MRFYDDCIDVIDWIEDISGYRLSTNLITLEELDELTETNEQIKEARGMFFDYPLSETTYITENADMFDGIQLVRFSNLYGGYEYRWCEVNA